MEKSSVIRLCGEYPENFQKLEILSDPNFVFKPDQNYQTRKVWDIEGNYVFVNSFQECEHYVLGGWSFDPLQQLEISHRFTLLAIVVVVFTLKIFLNNKFKI